MHDVAGVADVERVRPYPVPEFVDTVLADLRARGHADAQFDPSGFLARFDDDRRVLLDRVYYEVQSLPDAERARHIRDRLDAGMRPPPVSWGDAAPMLRSVLRPVSYAGAVTADGNRPWIRPLWPFVHELAILDTGDARLVVTQHETVTWGIDAERMFAVARGNIAARYPPQPQQQRVGHLLGDGNSYCDSAVLVPGWLGGFTDDDGARPLVFLPGDEVLLVCTDDPEVAPEFFAAADRLYRESAVPISPQAYTIAADTIVPLDVAGHSPLRPLAVGARSVLAEAEYLAQADRLQAFYAERMLDVRVGPVQLVETARGLCTMTVWGDGLAWVLPVADYVAFISADQTESFAVPFPVVADVVGLLPDAGVLPLRYSVAGWPAPDVVEMLRGHSVRLPGV
jgi:hypothetical protein